MNFDFVYKICTKSEWSEAKQNNIFKGTALDLKDGYIHFSDKDQVKQTLNKFYINQTNLKDIPTKKGFAENTMDQSMVYVVDYDMNHAEVMMLSKGNKLEIEYFGKRYPLTVTEEPLLDPENNRLKS